MDLNQQKLTKEEWQSIELPVSQEEKYIINLITKGYHNVNIKQNNTLSLLNYLKIANSDSIDSYIYSQYIEPTLLQYSKKYNYSLPYCKIQKSTLKKRDLIRFSNTDKNISLHKNIIFEFILLELIENMYEQKKLLSQKWLFYYYTLKILINYNVEYKNKTFIKRIIGILESVKQDVVIIDLVSIASDIIEHNAYLLKYADEKLYEHQKKLFSLVKHHNPKFIQYIAPTGTGKTMSPLGLSEGHKIIFVCAARHVGLALAKAAISINKKVAFAFGCGDAEDIRLHYSAAKDYIKNRRTGAIGKVDNTVGERVEIMISDIKSYIPAMLYMLAFNKKEDIILYWDEPTITLDYKEHEFHDIIKRNWRDNLIPNIVLSSATLPQPEDMQPTIQDFRAKFINGENHAIISYDCKKTIPLIDKNGYVAMPHLISNNYEEIVGIAKHCEKYKTLMRYIDLQEAVKFIFCVNSLNGLISNRYSSESVFTSFETVTMETIKMNYIKILGHIKPEIWPKIIEKYKRKIVHPSTIHIVTKDAYTLTDGPTIFLANDINKIAKFCLQQAEIPKLIIKNISEAMIFNSVITSKISVLQKTYEDGTKKDETKEKKISEGRVSSDMKRLLTQIDEIKACVKTVALDPRFIPNTSEHLERFDNINKNKAFACEISENIVEEIMLIDDVEDSWKLLLLMGIGVFATHKSIKYTEIMKKLAQQQKLYVIIASSDYIYGTNYQFCHSYLSKDLLDMTQEKCIQAMGRVGRNKLQQSYSIRFRDNKLINKLFKEEKYKPEVENMALLFNS